MCDMEVEESNSESPTHIMEPQVELDEELEHGALEPAVEIQEPQVELEEGTDQNDGNVFPYASLAVEYYEGADEAGVSNPNYVEGPMNGISHDSEDTSVDVAIHDNSQCNSGSIDDTSLDADELTMDTSNSEAIDSTINEEDGTNYNDLQRTYLQDFFSSSASGTVDESSNSTIERIPLSRFPSIVKVVERAEYETIQILYQLLYQRSAWDTQEILSKRILEFSGFTFGKTSEEYYNREMMLQTLPNSVLVKIGAILCLDQVKNVLSNVGLGRHDLIAAILEFLALPKKKTRGPRNNENKSASALNAEPCGCRNICLSKFTPVEREFVSNYHTTIKGKKKQDAYFFNLVQLSKSMKKPGEDSKKHRDHKYAYKIKLGFKEVNVCKGAFLMLHNIKASRINKIQERLKKGNVIKADLLAAQYPAPEGSEGCLPPPPKPVEESPKPVEESPKPVEKNGEESNECSIDNSITSATNSVEDSSESNSVDNSKNEDASVNSDDVIKVGDDVKKSIIQKVPAIVIEKIDPNKMIVKEAKSSSKSETKKDSSAKDVSKKKVPGIKHKLKDFPLVIKSLDEVSEELLIDLHFLLFLRGAESSKLKENILKFNGFSFKSDTEEYDERNEFLQRMSGKQLTDVARAFSLGVMSKREETIQNIISFLMKPEETYLRTASVPVILSDVELDDIEGMSDSDESITCEVVEKKVECIDLLAEVTDLSSGDESDKEERRKKSPVKAAKVQAPQPAAPAPTPAVPSTSTADPEPEPEPGPSQSSGGIRTLKNFETIRKIVNTHPPEYLVDIYELLFLKKHEPSTLRQEILDFNGFSFEKGSQDYIKRKQVLDRMLYNNVRRVYNTLIHNSTEVKVFSKPTMINEIFQFLFKLPDTDTSVRPLPPGAKTLMPKPATPAVKPKISTATAAPTAPPTPASILPSQTGKLSDLKRVFQRVACFPCEYLVDVHKLLFMSECDPKVIRQNIFGFKGFSFGVDSPEFQQRKMYLEYLTFHSLRKISSVLTTRSVDLRNSTKHELASHLTDVLAEYCNTLVETETLVPASGNQESQPATTTVTASTANSNVESIVITPVIEGIQSGAAPTSSSAPKAASAVSTPMNISIVDTRSISSPAVSTSSSGRGSRKRKNQTVRQLVSEKKIAPSPQTQPADSSQFADINLPEIEQYRQIYGANLNVYPSVPTITGIASFSAPVSQSFQQFSQSLGFPIVSPYPQSLQVQSLQQPTQMIGLQSTALTMTTPIITQVSNNPTELIISADIEKPPEEPQVKVETADIPKTDNSQSNEEDGDTPLSALIGHPIDSVITKHISDIVEKTDLQDITMNGVIQRIYDMFPKFDLSYRKEFIKTTLRTILYKLGDENQKSNKKDVVRDSNSPDSSVTTTDNRDSS